MSSCLSGYLSIIINYAHYCTSAKYSKLVSNKLVEPDYQSMNISYAICKTLWNQSWISLRAKKPIYKQLCKFGPAPDAPFECDFFGLQYHGNLNNSIEFNIYYHAAFEKPLLFFLRDTLQALSAATTNPMVFTDIGANIGQHSLFMSRFADQIYAFEPFAPVRDRLQYHIHLNQVRNIQVHAVGLSQRDELLPFFAPTGRNQGIGSFDSTTISKGNVDAGKLQLVNGDAYLAMQRMQAPALMKIDVEGFEKNVLLGLRDTLATARPVLVTEITYGKALSFENAEDLLQVLPPNYQLFAFDTRKSDGGKARRRGAQARRSGHYQLVEFRRWLPTGQDDVIACPLEKVALLPLSGPVVSKR